MPRGGGTTASAAPGSRADQDAAAPDSGGPGPGLGSAREGARCARIVRMTAGSCSVAIRRSRPPQWAQAKTPTQFTTRVVCIARLALDHEERLAAVRRSFRERHGIGELLEVDFSVPSPKSQPAVPIFVWQRFECGASNLKCVPALECAGVCPK